MKSIGIFWSDIDSTGKIGKGDSEKTDGVPVKQLEPNNARGDDSFDLQLNLWNTEVEDISTKARQNFCALDIGLVFPRTVRELTFLLPFRVDKQDFSDLAGYLSRDTELLCTVFNEDLKTSSEPSKSYHLIDGGDIHYIMYELAKENIINLEYDETTDVTELTLSINTDFNSDLFKSYSVFVRFRLKLHDLSCFARKKQVSNDWLQSAFSSTYMFDIRVNDGRELSKKKRELVEHKGYRMPLFTKIHFFYMAHSEEMVENGSSIKLDSRLLEKDRWHNYLGQHFEFVSENLAHHWKSKIDKHIKLQILSVVNDIIFVKTSMDVRNVHGFTLYFKTKFEDPRRNRIVLYLTIVILMGIISSAFVSCFSLVLPVNKSLSAILYALLIILVSVIIFCGLRKECHKKYSTWLFKS